MSLLSGLLLLCISERLIATFLSPAVYSSLPRMALVMTVLVLPAIVEASTFVKGVGSRAGARRSAQSFDLFVKDQSFATMRCRRASACAVFGRRWIKRVNLFQPCFVPTHGRLNNPRLGNQLAVRAHVQRAGRVSCKAQNRREALRHHGRVSGLPSTGAALRAMVLAASERALRVTTTRAPFPDACVVVLVPPGKRTRSALGPQEASNFVIVPLCTHW